MKINIIKRLMAVSLSAIMLVSTMAVPASAAKTGSVTFSDVKPGDWYYEAVMAMADAGVVNGYSNGTFHPNSTITLGEAAAVAWRLYGSHICSVDELAKITSGSIGYENMRTWINDIGQNNEHIGYMYPTHWAGSATAHVYAYDYAGWDYIASMVDQPISRGRAISTVVEILTKGGIIERRLANSDHKTASNSNIPDWNVVSDIHYESNKSAFTGVEKDVPTNGQYWNYFVPEFANTICVPTGFAGTWRTSYILKAYQAGIVTGTDASGTCDPTALVTRAQFCQMLYNAGLPDNSMYGNYQKATTFKRNGKYYCFNYHQTGSTKEFGPDAFMYLIP